MRRPTRSADDGYRSDLAPGLRSTDDARRLAQEIAFATGRLGELAASPRGLYAEVANGADEEEALWLAFLIAYLGPSDDDAPFAGIAGARTSWGTGELPALEDVLTGPRTAHDQARGARTVAAYRAWAQRSGSQADALRGEEHWSSARRFARTFERLSLPGLHRGARFDLLASLSRLGRLDAAADSLFLRGDDETTLGAKRAFGIADPLLLDRRALALAEACGVPLEALDLALFNWQRGERARLGASSDAGDPAAEERASSGLGLS